VLLYSYYKPLPPYIKTQHYPNLQRPKNESEIVFQIKKICQKIFTYKVYNGAIIINGEGGGENSYIKKDERCLINVKNGVLWLNIKKRYIIKNALREQ